MSKRPVVCEMVKELDHVKTDRGMTLIGHESRCLAVGTIHELVTCDEAGRMPGDRIDLISKLFLKKLSLFDGF